MTKPRTQSEWGGKDGDAAQPGRRKDSSLENEQNTGSSADTDNFVDPRGNTGVSVAKTGDATDPSAAGGLATKETTNSRKS